MSRLSQLLTLVRSLPQTPLRPANSSQLADGLESIIHRAFPISSASSSSSSKVSSINQSPLVESTLTPSDSSSPKSSSKVSSVDQSPLAESTLTPSDSTPTKSSSKSSLKGSSLDQSPLGETTLTASDASSDQSSSPKVSSLLQSPLPEAALTASDSGPAVSGDKTETRHLGPSEERAVEEMISAIERIKSNFALQRVCPLFPGLRGD